MALSGNTVWEVRTGGSDTNGGGFVTGSGGTDYSQQDAAQLSVTDAACTGNTTVTSATGGFTSAMIGSIMYLSSGPGWYQITARTDTNTITIDRNGPNASGMTANVGGAFATLQAALNLMTVGGMTTWVKSATYTHTALVQTVTDDSSYGTRRRIIGYTTTRGDKGKPTLRWTAAVAGINIRCSGHTLENFILDGTSTGTTGIYFNGSYGFVMHNCKVMDWTDGGIQSCTVHNCEVTGVSGGLGAVYGGNVTGSWIHDNSVTGLKQCGSIGNLITNNTGGSSDGIDVSGFYGWIIANNICHGNGRHGIKCDGYAINNTIINNILTSNGGYGLTYALANGVVTPEVHHNAYWSNTSGAYYGCGDFTGDVILSADPFVDAASDDYNLNNIAGGGADLRAASFTMPG